MMSYRNCLRFYRCYSSVVQNKHKVCIVGSGPAGFYAAMQLTKKLKDVEVDIIEKLPVPFGLVRYGVAPDHPEVKNVMNSFTKVATQPNVNFYGNIMVGRDVTLKQLRENYHAVLLAYGAEEDRRLGIENEDYVLPARRFVGWYNGLPWDADFQVDLSGTTAAIFGQGNVAMDVARILLTPIDILKTTDITKHALNVLSESNIKTVYLIGRRGPLQAAYTIKELREQIKLHKCQTIWREEDFEGVELFVDKLPRPKKRIAELMLSSLKDRPNPTAEKYFKPIFKRSPAKFLVENSKLVGVELIKNQLKGDDPLHQWSEPTDEREILRCDVVFRSIGYKSVKVEDCLNFDDKKGLIVNENGRVLKKDSTIDWGLYVVGWLRTGPLGVILNTMSNAFQVAGNLIEDLNKNSAHLNLDVNKPGFEGIKEILKDKNIRIVDWEGWEKIDQFEMDLGSKVAKPREKIVTVDKMLEVCYK